MDFHLKFDAAVVDSFIFGESLSPKVRDEKRGRDFSKPGPLSSDKGAHKYTT